MRGLAVLMLVAGCGADPAVAEGPACDVDPDHPLRVRCEAPSGPLHVELVGPDGRLHVHDADGDALIAWGLRPSARYTWRADAGGVGAVGTLTSGAVPEDERPDVAVDGAPTVDGVVFPSCEQPGRVVWVDAAGALVGYVDLPDSPTILGISAGEGDEVLAIVWPYTVARVRPTGEVQLLDLEPVVPGPLHHDVVARGDRLWVLHAIEEDGVVGDGVAVVDGQGALLGSIDTRELYDTTALGELEIDRYWYGVWGQVYGLAHANSVDVDDDGTLAISLRDLDGVVGVSGDPDAQDFGAVRWSVEGADGPALDATAASDPFAHQHHVRLTADGLTLFDNGDPDSDALSRGVALAWDGGALREVASWPMERSCPVQGAAVPLDDGGALLTCAFDDVVEDRGPDGALRGAFAVGCDDPVSYEVLAWVSRALPVALP